MMRAPRPTDEHALQRKAEGRAPASPAAAAVVNEQHRQLMTLLDQLAPRQREALLLRYFEALSVEQTAVVMDCAAGTVKATVSQALAQLRLRWNDKP